jgi:hypothetical protein
MEQSEQITIAVIATKVDRLISDVKEIKDNTLSDIAVLKKNKADQEAVDRLNGTNEIDHKALLKRVEKLEIWRALLTGIAIIIPFILEFILRVFFRV